MINTFNMLYTGSGLIMDIFACSWWCFNYFDVDDWMIEGVILCWQIFGIGFSFLLGFLQFLNHNFGYLILWKIWHWFFFICLFDEFGIYAWAFQFDIIGE